MPSEPINLLEKPSWAAYIWSDATSIWVELPCPTGKAPVIVQYSKTEGGLAKALSLIDQNANIARKPPLPGHFKAYHEARPAPRRTEAVPKLMNQPQALRDAVKAALRKVGL